MGCWWSSRWKSVISFPQWAPPSLTFVHPFNLLPIHLMGSKNLQKMEEHDLNLILWLWRWWWWWGNSSKFSFMLCCSLHRYPVFLWFYCCCYWPILSPMNPNREISSVSVSMLSKFKQQAWLPSQRRGKVLIEVGHIQLSKTLGPKFEK